MKISARETESLAVKLWNEAKKQERKKVKEFEKNYTIVKVSSRVFKALKSLPSDIAEEVLSYSKRTADVGAITSLVASIRYNGPKAKSTTALKHEIVLLARDCKTIEEIIGKINLLEQN